MSADGVKAGQAYVKVTAKSDVSKKLEQDRRSLINFAQQVVLIGATMAAVTVAVYGPIAKAASQFMEMGSTISDMSQATGIATDSLSALGFAAELAGADLFTLQSGLNGLAKFAGKVATGSKGAVEILGRLGIGAQDFLAAGPEDRLRMLADGLKQISDPQLRAATAAQVFGKAGMNMILMLNEGSEGLDAFLKQARELGIVITPEAAARADALGDAWDIVGKVWSFIGFHIGSAFAETLTRILQVTARLGGMLNHFLMNNQKLVLSLGLAAAFAGAVVISLLGMAAAGVLLKMVFVGLVTLVNMATAAWSFLAMIQAAAGIVNAWLTANLTMEGLAALWASIQTWLLNIALTVLTGVATAAAAALTFLLSPLGLILLTIGGLSAALIGGTIYWLAYTQSGQQALSNLAAGFGMLWQAAAQTTRGIFDAILAGNWGLAGKVAMGGIYVAWYQGMLALRSMWAGFKSFLLNLFAAIVESVSRQFANMIGGIAAALDKLNRYARLVGLGVPGANGARGAAAAVRTAGAGAAGSLRNAGAQMATKEVTAALRDLLDAQAKLTEATDQAAKEREEKFDSLFKLRLPDFSVGLPDQGAGFGSAATFNSRIAELLGRSASSPEQRTADATEAMQEDMERIREKLEEGGVLLT
jgi:hypothetical protein